MTAAVACPCCTAVPEAGDRFCEVCGVDLGARRESAADHVEIAVDGGAAVSDRGHVRAANEDAVALGGVQGRVAAVVCDGVSSTRSSERAARIAADTALDLLLGARTVHDAIAAGAAATAGLVPSSTPDAPACTLVCAVYDAGLLTVGWVGDSRAYWLAERGAARLLTADHTAEAAAAAGTLDPATAAARPDAITRWLGGAGDTAPDVVTLVPEGPGAVLLCTDGLWKYLPDAAALAAVALPALRRGGARAAAAALTAAALAAGGADNVTVAVLPVVPEEEP